MVNQQVEVAIVNQHKLTTSLLAICFILLSGSLHAANLGRMTAISGLGEPLIAEIDLEDVNQAELASYTARLASEDSYVIQGIKKSAVQSDIKVDVVKKYNGASVLKLYSSQVINDQSINLLIQLDWPTGRMLKEYLLVLESLKSLGSAPVAPPVVLAKPSAPLNKAIPSDVLTSSKPKMVLDNEPAPSATTAASTTQDYVAGKGDSLSKIASQMQVEGMNLEQMVRALYEANKDAFIDGDINRLKAGAVLKMPAQAEVKPSAAKPAEEDRGVAVKSDDWSAYRHKVASMATEQTPDATANSATENKIKTKVDAEKPADKPRDVLRLSKTDNLSDQSLSKIAQLTAEKQALEDELTVGNKRLDDAATRIKSLEKQVVDLQNLLALSNKTISDLQAKQNVSQISLFYNELKRTLNQPSDMAMVLIALLLMVALFMLKHMLSSTKPKPIVREEPKL